MSENLDERRVAIRDLMDSGASRGYILFDEIDQVLPPEDQSLTELRRLIEFALEGEIDVVASLRDRPRDRTRSRLRIPKALRVPQVRPSSRPTDGAGTWVSAAELADAHKALVEPMAKRFAGRGLKPKELLEAGTAALELAALKFSPAREYPFAPFAEWFVWQGVLNAVSQAGALTLNITASHEIDEQLLDTESLVRQLGRVPTTEEIATRTGKTRDSVERLELMQLRFGRVGEFWRRRCVIASRKGIHLADISLDDAGRQFMRFMERCLPITACKAHGPECPDTQRQVQMLSMELRRPGVLKFLARDLDSLCRLEKGRVLVESLLFKPWPEWEPILTWNEFTALFSAWSESPQNSDAVNWICHLAMSLRPPSDETRNQRWIDFFNRTRGPLP